MHKQPKKSMLTMKGVEELGAYEVTPKKKLKGPINSRVHFRVIFGSR